MLCLLCQEILQKEQGNYSANKPCVEEKQQRATQFVHERIYPTTQRRRKKVQGVNQWVNIMEL